MFKSKKGITLVALVVTIVVLLILAGVSINLVLGDNGIITKAKEAETKSAEARENDLKGMNSLIDQMESALNGGSSNNKEENELGKLVSDMGTLPGDTTPYFPSSDFKRREKTNTENGLVIEDSEGNQYVWVVVPKSLYNNAAYNNNTKNRPSLSTDYANIEYCLQQYTATYRGNTDFSDVYYPDDKNVGWLTSDEYTELKNKMLKSVYENGGFYVGRYEAGIGTNRTRTSIEAQVNGKYPVPTTAPVSKADAYPYTYVTRTQAQNLASKVNAGTKTTSSLMFGVQWDLVLAFMSKDTAKIRSTEDLTQDSRTIGNYSDSTFQLSQTGQYAVFSNGSLSSTWNPSTTATANFVDSSRNKIAQSSYGDGVLVTTGTSEKNKVMNIYDVAGNVWEWTLEKTSDTDSPCAYRGGQFNFTGSLYPAAYRDDHRTGHSDNDIGFRVALF